MPHWLDVNQYALLASSSERRSSTTWGRTDEEAAGPRGSRDLDARGLLGRVGIGTLTLEPTGGVIWNANRGAISLRATMRGELLNGDPSQTYAPPREQKKDTLHDRADDIQRHCRLWFRFVKAKQAAASGGTTKKK